MRVWVSAAYWDKWYTGASVQMVGQPDRYKSYPEPFAHLLTDRQVQMAGSKEAHFFEFYPVHLQLTTIKADKHDQSRYQGAFAH